MENHSFQNRFQWPAIIDRPPKIAAEPAIIKRSSAIALPKKGENGLLELAGTSAGLCLGYEAAALE